MGQAVKAITVLGMLAVLTVGVSSSPGATSMLVPTHAIRGVVKTDPDFEAAFTSTGHGGIEKQEVRTAAWV